MSNPRNRRPRAVGTFTFQHNGRTYSLPPASAAVRRVKAGVLIDAATGDDDAGAQMQMGMALIKAATPDIPREAMAALRDMDIITFGRTIGTWMQQTGADPGKSEPSLG